MSSRIRVFATSVGTKLLIGITGLALFLFLISHIAGNALILLGPTVFNHYSHTLTSNPLIPVIENGRSVGSVREGRVLARVLENREVLNHQIHDVDTINLNPATNVMNPRAEAMLSKGLGSRPSLGYPGEKYEMGLEAIEQIEVIAAELVAEVFGARYAEVRVPCKKENL